LKTPFSSRAVALLIFGSALLFLSTSLYTLLFLTTTNTLENNGQWVSTKATLNKGVIGGVAYAITPVALNRSQLNLGALFGFQEVLTREPVRAREISFDLSLAPDSYATLLYHKGPAGSSGLRLSRNPHSPSAHLKIDPQGQFLERVPFEPKLKDGWNHFRAIFSPGETSLYASGQFVGKFQDPLPPSGQIGFRGGPFEAAVDRVSLRLEDGRMILESFENRRNFWQVFGGILLALLAFNALLLLWARSKSRKNPSLKIIHYFVTANLLLILLQPLLYLTQFYCLSKFTALSKIYFKAAVAIRGIPSPIETREQIIARLKKEYPLVPREGGRRILIIGTSQTWGAGADRPDRTFVKRLEDLLNRDKDREAPYQLINAGISGDRAMGLYELYAEQWISWKPQAVLINLSNNDLEASQFSQAIENFIQLNQSQGIQTILILEPNTIESVRDTLPTNHRIMRELAERFKIPLIDLKSCLDARHGDGFLWWDFVHLSSFGHEEAAQCLFSALKGILPQGKTSPETGSQGRPAS